MSGNEKADLNSTAIFAQRRTTMCKELPVRDLWREAGPLRGTFPVCYADGQQRLEPAGGKIYQYDAI